ncbi:MAG: Ig-like domain-containing protein, partial [Gammaproteobacteria bacterium]
TLIPSSDLLPNTQYIATIASSVKDLNGNSPLSSDFVWSFTTAPSMQLVSNNASGVVGDNTSQAADIDATGRYIVFESRATNLTPVTTPQGISQIYRKDTITGEVVLVSSDGSGLVEADTQASNPSISSNGRYVVFESTASNLDADSNGTLQVYLKDLNSGLIKLVSRNENGDIDNGTTGASNAKISNNGDFVLFQSSDSTMSPISSSINQIYLKNVNSDTGTVVMISREDDFTAGNAPSSNPDMSADGVHIVFESEATNLTGSTSFRHIYYVDTTAVPHAVEQISVATGGTEATANSDRPSVSDDGLAVVFHTVDALDGADGNGVADVYIRYRSLGTTELVSANPNTSNSGNGASSNAHISGNGDYVVFESLASDLVNGDVAGIKDIFVRNLSVMSSIIIDRVSDYESGLEATSPSDGPVISTDGRYVGFDSVEPFTIEDVNGLSDVFRVHNSTSQ